MGALSSLLMLKPADESLQDAWVSSVLPLAGDPEQTCQVCTKQDDRYIRISFFFFCAPKYVKYEGQ